MSWLGVFKKARESGFSAEELAMIEQQARAEFESVFSKNGYGKNGNGNGHKPEPAYHRVIAHEEVIARSTKRANVLPLRDWRTVEGSAEELGMKPDEVEKVITAGKLARVDFPYASALVHVRQIAYWCEHKRLLDVDMTIFDDWKRQADISRETGVPAQVLSKMIADGKIAVYKPHPRIALLNEREVYEVGR
jgi:hypothetical protein